MAQIEQAQTKVLPGIRPSFRQGLTYGGLLSAAGTATQAEIQKDQALATVGQTLQKYTYQITRDLQEDQDKSFVRDLYNQYTNEARKIKEEAQSASRKDAIGVTQRTKEQLDKLAAKYDKLLQNDRQRELFQPLMLSRQIATLDIVGNHERAETYKYKTESAKEMAEAVIEEGIQDYTNPNSAKVVAQKLKLAVEDIIPGANQEEKSYLYKQYMSAYHLGVLKQFAMADSAAAQEYFNNVKNHMLGTDQLKAKAILKTATTTQKIEIKAQEIWQKSQGDLKTALEMADKIKDPLIRAEVRKELVTRQRMEAYAQKQQEQQEFDQADQAIADMTSYDNAVKYIQNTNLPASKQAVLLNLARQRFTTGGVKTDWNTYYQLLSLPRTKFIKVDLQKFRDRLSDTEFKHLVEVQRKMKFEKPMVTLHDLTRLANNTLEAIGLPEDKKDKDVSEKRLRFFMEFYKRLSELPSEQRNITNASQILDDMTKEVVIHRPHWFDIRKPKALLDEDERREYIRQQVPFDPENPPPDVMWDEELGAWVRIDSNGQLQKWVPGD